MNNPPRAWVQRSAFVLIALLCYGILTLWVEERWAWSLFQTGAFGTALAWMLRWTFKPWRFAGSVLAVPLTTAPIWGLIQLMSGQTAYRWATWNAVLNWATDLVIFLLALQILMRRQVRHLFLRSLVWFGAAIAVIATLQTFTSEGKIFWMFPSGYSDLVLGPFVSRNQYAAFMEMILPITLWQALHAGRKAFGYCFMASLMVASVIASQSRAGSVLIVAEVGAVFLAAYLRGILAGRAALTFAAQFACMAVVFTAVVGWEELWHRFQQPDPYAVRREMLLSSIDMLRERPWTGFGLGTWPTVYPKYAYYDNGTFANQAHNDWAQWAVEGGIPLLLMMSSVAVLSFRRAVRSLWGIGLISVLLHCWVDYPMQQRPVLSAWFFVMLGALASSAPQKQEGEPPGTKIATSQECAAQSSTAPPK